MIESDTKAFQSPLKCSYLTFRGQHSSRESHTYFNISIVPLLSCTENVASHESAFKFTGPEDEIDLILC